MEILIYIDVSSFTICSLKMYSRPTDLGIDKALAQTIKVNESAEKRAVDDIPTAPQARACTSVLRTSSIPVSVHKASTQSHNASRCSGSALLYYFDAFRLRSRHECHPRYIQRWQLRWLDRPNVSRLLLWQLLLR